MRGILSFLLLGCALLAQSSAPHPGLPNLPVHPVGVNDLVAVTVYGASELSRTVRVGSDGMLRMPMLKQRVKAAGLMPADLEASIARAISDEQLLVDPFVTVTVAEYHSRPIAVMGAVKRPVTFQAEASVTLLEALARAEGLSAAAGPEILLTRLDRDGHPQVQRIAVKVLIDAADPASNVVLSGGEEVRVPEAGKVFVVGNVKRPGAFPIQDAAESTLLKALAMSEGTLPFTARQAYIYRPQESGGKLEIPVELRQIMRRKAPDVPLLANDILYIPDNQGRRLSVATLEKALVIGTAATSALIYGTTR